MQGPNRIYLTRRNLLTLLSKLDRVKAGEQSHATIIKYRNDRVDEYKQDIDSAMIVAVEDEPYYAAMNRDPGPITPEDEYRIQYGYK